CGTAETPDCGGRQRQLPLKSPTWRVLSETHSIRQNTRATATSPRKQEKRMGATGYFPAYGDDEEIADVSGSSFGEPDGTVHRIEVLEGNGHLIVRVRLKDYSGPVDLLFNKTQAVAFNGAVQAVLRRLGLDH